MKDGIREDEKGYLKECDEAHPDVEIDYTHEIFTAENAEPTEGSDGVFMVKTRPY